MSRGNSTCGNVILSLFCDIHSALHVACAVDTWLDQNNSLVIIVSAAALLHSTRPPPHHPTFIRSSYGVHPFNEELKLSHYNAHNYKVKGPGSKKIYS
jgi:hypothetical protein